MPRLDSHLDMTAPVAMLIVYSSYSRAEREVMVAWIRLGSKKTLMDTDGHSTKILFCYV